MPLYAYKCNDCESIFERQQRMLEPPVRECPECQGSVRRLINNVGIVFKGSGFYVTDNRNGNGRVKAPNGTSETKTSETTTTSDKSETSGSTSATTPTESKQKTEVSAAAA